MCVVTELQHHWDEVDTEGQLTWLECWIDTDSLESMGQEDEGKLSFLWEGGEDVCSFAEGRVKIQLESLLNSINEATNMGDICCMSATRPLDQEKVGEDFFRQLEEASSPQALVLLWGLKYLNITEGHKK